MILEFGAKNFFSFKEGFMVNLRLNKSCPEFISNNKDYINLLSLQGANASGKTNVLKLLSFVNYFVLHSFSGSKPDEIIPFNSYFNNNEETEIFIVFLDKEIEYTYELKLTNERIISEVFYKKNKRVQQIIKRSGNKLEISTGIFKELKAMKLRDNVSLVSTALQYEMESINGIANLFRNILAPNVSEEGLHTDNWNYKAMSEYYFDNKELFSFVKKILKKADNGISDIKIVEKENDATGDIEYFPIFIYNINSKKHVLKYYEQSSGVKSLFIQLGFYKLALIDGCTLILDEFDINLHPDLLPMLIDLFEDTKINKNNGQLIFTSHNDAIMNKLSKYRIILVNKDDNESYLYRLDEIPGDILRNDRSISSVYNTGKIGGKPKL